MRKKRLRIGILTDWISTNYHKKIIEGIDSIIKKNDYSLTIFEGGSLSLISKFDTCRNNLYNLVNSSIIDGLLILTGSLALNNYDTVIENFINKLKLIPKVSLGGVISGIPSVILNNKIGFKELLEHLIIDHKYKNFAFIKGPDDHEDAVDRYHMFIETLKQHNLPINEKLIYNGDFTGSSGIDAGQYFYNKGIADIDVIVSANDVMALEAKDYLHNKGLKIPHDIAITGFDNIEIAVNSLPGLTTVTQNFDIITKTACENLIELINTGSCAQLVEIPTHFIKRETCGCNLFDRKDIYDNSILYKSYTKKEVIENSINYLKKHNINCLKEDFLELEKNIELIFASIKDKDKSVFYKAIVDMTNKVIKKELLPENMKIIIFSIVFPIFYQMKNDLLDKKSNGNFMKDDYLFLDELSCKFIDFINDKTLQYQTERNIKQSNEKDTLLLISRELIVNLNTNVFYEEISGIIKRFKIDKTFIVFYNNKNSKTADLVYCFKDNECVIPSEEEEYNFTTNSLLPEKYFTRDKSFTLIIDALVGSDENFGYIVFEKTGKEWDFYDQLYLLINNAIQLHLFFKKTKVQKDNLVFQKENFDKNINFFKRAMTGFIETLEKTIEIRDPYTAAHQRRVAKLAKAIAFEMKLPEFMIEGIKMASLVHDLGKIYIPAEILNRPGKLTPLEYELIKAHPAVAYNILKNIDFPWPIAEIVYQHQERINGAGYPRKLKNNDILFEAKILCVADVVEAMSSHRPYRPSLGIEAALEEISINVGIKYDEEVVTVCQKIFRDKNLFEGSPEIVLKGKYTDN